MRFGRLCFVLALAAMSLPTPSRAQEGGRLYEVTITNLTRGQQFTPILVATHRANIRLFDVGRPASAELATLAEEGDTGPLTSTLLASRDVHAVTNSGALLDPGKSVSVQIATTGTFDRISVASMLIPTNDAFMSVTAEVPTNLQTLMLSSPAYDSGTERNDETCASIPGPSFVECGGPGGGGKPSGGEEGFVHIHAGIHGIGNFMPSNRDWRNPVARILVRRIR